MSLGGGASASLDDAVRRVVGSGLSVVAAAGNETTDACTGSPSRVAEAITVGATTRRDSRASFSNYGACLDVFAPGDEITSAWHSASNVVAVLSGTSMAAPHVAGLVALMLEKSPNSSPASIGSTLVQTATPNIVTNALSASNRLVHVEAVAGIPIGGTTGADIMSGTAGADLMSGRTGDDIYYVNHPDDVVQDAPGEGSDPVAASVSYTLPAGSEIELMETITLSATTPLNLTGNALSNIIVGNNGANRLPAGGGNDSVYALGGDDAIVGGSSPSRSYGGPGNDTYYVRDASDRVVEAAGEGFDRIAASTSYALLPGSEVETFEVITLSATNALNLAGSDHPNTLRGNNGANTLDGRGGSDVLQGLGGSDTFLFSVMAARDNVDTLLDLNPEEDGVALSGATFAGLAPGALAAEAFVIGSGPRDSDDRVVYDPQTGSLLFDPDGSGPAAAVEFARTAAGLTLTAANFRIL